MDEKLHKAIVNFCKNASFQYYKNESSFSNKWIYERQFFKDKTYIKFTKIVKIPFKENEFGEFERDYYECEPYKYQITIEKSYEIIHQEEISQFLFTDLLSKCSKDDTAKALKKFTRKYC